MRFAMLNPFVNRLQVQLLPQPRQILKGERCMARRIKVFASALFVLYASVILAAFGVIVYIMTTCWRYDVLMELLKAAGLR